MRLSEGQVRALIKLVQSFARETREATISKSMDNKQSKVAAEHTSSPSKNTIDEKKKLLSNVTFSKRDQLPVCYAHKLSAEWLKRYLVHLRCSKRSKPWNEWMGQKEVDMKNKIAAKPKDFIRALAGRFTIFI